MQRICYLGTFAHYDCIMLSRVKHIWIVEKKSVIKMKCYHAWCIFRPGEHMPLCGNVLK